MRFTDIDVNFDLRYEGHQNYQKILSMNILRVFSEHHLWCQNWCQYLWTSLCQFNFFVNLLHSLGVWFFDIWHFFDNLTSFWYFGSKSPMGPIAHVSHTPVPHCPCIPLATWPISLVPHTPVALLPMCPIPLYPIPPVGLIAHIPHTPVPHCPCDPIAHVAHVAHRPHTPVPHFPYPLYPIPPVPYCPCAPIAHRPHGPYLYAIPPVHYCPKCLSPLPPLGNGPYG